ncbi:hypothetical protein LG200_09385 [Methylobacillus caricis]|uniref:hypothetical protein n=1 Tax=Methylobacillus caricis TaxID=1971611 RepID=UPI001CFF627C|nr:hypothetical protein [Methylobacillus caricis]MCB5188209.1 hypothetical protein [Methylobacillus caricis]
MSVPRQPVSAPNQRGAALLLVIFIIGLAVTAYVVKSYDAAAMKARQEEKTMKALAEAKEALIAWTVAHPDWPGTMPFPDRLETTMANYDGKSDCVPSNLNYPHLIGKLPIYSDSGCANTTYHTNLSVTDSATERLWYAVSRNLIRTSNSSPTPVINPGVLTVNTALPYPYDGTHSTSAYPWMKVFDRQGQLVSDRVAVVIIAPGPPLKNQDRSGGLVQADMFLERVVFSDKTIANYDYTKPDEDFVMGGLGDSEINDRLIYITIDELMIALETRVVAEAKKAINFPVLYQSSPHEVRSFPWMVPEKSSPAWPADFSYEAGRVGQGYIPFRCVSNSACNTYRSEVAWHMTSLSGGSSGTLTLAIVDSFKEYSFADAECIVQSAGAPLLDCTGVITQNLPETVEKRIVNLILNANINAGVYDSLGSSGLYEFRKTFTVPAQTVVKLQDVQNSQTSSMTLRTQSMTSVNVSKLSLYPVLPEWYFTNRWYEFMYAVIAPAFRPGGDGICAVDTCLHLHYTKNGVVNKIDNLPALIFTRRPPDTYMLNAAADIDSNLDFVKPAVNSTGMVGW